MVDGAALGGGGDAAQAGGGGALDELVDEGHFAHEVDGVGWSLVAGQVAHGIFGNVKRKYGVARDDSFNSFV